MGRRRTKDLHLPPKLQRRACREGFSYFYVSEGKWTWLAHDEPTALRLWAMLEGKQTGATVGELAQLWWSFQSERTRRKEPECLGTGTLKQYAAFIRSIDKRFPAMQAAFLTVHDMLRWKQDCKRIWFNGCLSVLRNAYRWGIVNDYVDENPLRDVEFNQIPVRPRYITDEEFVLIRRHAVEWLQIAMDLAYIMGMRRSDVMALRWDKVSADGIHVTQVKGRLGVHKRQFFPMTPEIKEVLDRARGRRIVGLYVVANDKGRPITKHKIEYAFANARAAAGIENVTFHDIRGKYATDGEADGIDIQAGLGHTTARMSQRYVKAKQVTRAPSLRRSIR